MCVVSNNVGRRWWRIGLARRYALASAPVFLALAIGLGWWVGDAIARQVIQNTAVNVALYVQSFLGPPLQDLAHQSSLDEETITEIQSLLTNTPLGKRVVSIKIWTEGGKIAWYSRRKLINMSFEPTETMKKAWSGVVTAELSNLSGAEDVVEADLNVHLLEVYSPVRENGTERVIAVAEFYQDATTLSHELLSTRIRTWLVVVGAAILAYLLLFGIVRKGGRVIQFQREALRGKVTELEQLLKQNKDLTGRVRRATQRTTELNERFLRRVSAELHDGPAQYVGLALLRLDSIDTKDRERAETSKEPCGDIEDVRRILREALDEIRFISRGLALPELKEVDVVESLQRAVRSHERRTGQKVELSTSSIPRHAKAPMPVKITAYRIVQEALMNSFRHANAGKLRVHAAIDSDWLTVDVVDDGGGFDLATASAGDSLGLNGLRERVESIGGKFDVETEMGAGTTVSARLPLGSNL
ncbi:MAG: sensor histidine kinase [Proteobacteria bacterium]|nr:MAG: sensor histidine kinase [Pseudomonadota bacterium]